MKTQKKSDVLNQLFSQYANLQIPMHGSGVSEPEMSYGVFFSNKVKLINLIQVGISFSLFESIKALFPFVDQEWADFLGTSTKSLQRYKADGNFVFKPLHSEKIIELAEVIYFGLEVFDTEAQFFEWFHTVSYALGGVKPIDLVKDSYGKELVLDEINRLEYGVFA